MSISETICKLRFLTDTKAIDAAKVKIGEIRGAINGVGGIGGGALGQIKGAVGGVAGRLGLGGISFAGGAVAAAATAAGVFAAKMAQASEEAYRIGQQLSGIGVTTGKGFAVVEAFERVGKGADQAIEAIAKAEAFRTKALEGEANMGKAAEIFGFGMQELKDMDAVDLLKRIGQAFENGATPAEKWAAQIALGEQALRNMSALQGIGTESVSAELAARWGKDFESVKSGMNGVSREGAGMLRFFYESATSTLEAGFHQLRGEFAEAEYDLLSLGTKMAIEEEKAMERMRKQRERDELAAAEEQAKKIARARYIEWEKGEKKYQDFLASERHIENMDKLRAEAAERERKKKEGEYVKNRAMLRVQIWNELDEERAKSESEKVAKSESEKVAGIDPSRLRTSILASSQTSIGGMFGATVSTTDYADQSLVTLKQILEESKKTNDNLSS